jgi:Trp operon repressor
VRANGKKMIAVDLPLPASAKTVTQTVYSDLTENPLAGLDVDIVLEAKDGAGQTGRSKSARIKLPARVFTNPLARALIEQRQNLALGGDNAIPKAEHTLEALTIAPDRFYANQGGVYLAHPHGLLGIAHRTRRGECRAGRGASVADRERHRTGRAAQRRQQLRQLQQLLSQALAQGAPQDVIDALLQRYRDALARYLQILAENAQPSNGAPPNARTVSAEDFEKLLKEIQQLAQTGSRDQAQRLLAMMQSLIENMHMAQGGRAAKATRPATRRSATRSRASAI